MHRVIARTRSVDVAEESAKSFVPDGRRQVLGMYKCFWQEFDTEAEARALIMRSIMNYERGDPDTMRIKLINFRYNAYYYTPYVFCPYDKNDSIGRQNNCNNNNSSSSSNDNKSREYGIRFFN